MGMMGTVADNAVMWRTRVAEIGAAALALPATTASVLAKLGAGTTSIAGAARPGRNARRRRARRIRLAPGDPRVARAALGRAWRGILRRCRPPRHGAPGRFHGSRRVRRRRTRGVLRDVARSRRPAESRARFAQCTVADARRRARRAIPACAVAARSAPAAASRRDRPRAHVVRRNRCRALRVRDRTGARLCRRGGADAATVDAFGIRDRNRPCSS